MTQKIFSKITIVFTIFITIAVLIMLIWEYYHGGVSGHHFLKRKDMPFISNWWGLLLLPLVTFLSLKRIGKRINFNQGLSNQDFIKHHLLPFLMALLFGILIVVFSSTGNSEISYFMFLALFVVALFIPIFKAEYFLGFILGLSYSFGGALPVVIAIVLATIFYIIFNYIRPIFIFIGTKIKK
jgi:hypothetical protein